MNWLASPPAAFVDRLIEDHLVVLTHQTEIPVGDAKKMVEAILTTLVNPLLAETLRRAVTQVRCRYGGGTIC